MVSGSGVVLAIAPLFVPATRPGRFAKAATSGADAIIVDLEDAVAREEKSGAREALFSVDLPSIPIIDAPVRRLAEQIMARAMAIEAFRRAAVSKGS